MLLFLASVRSFATTAMLAGTASENMLPAFIIIKCTVTAPDDKPVVIEQDGNPASKRKKRELLLGLQEESCFRFINISSSEPSTQRPLSGTKWLDED